MALLRPPARALRRPQLPFRVLRLSLGRRACILVLAAVLPAVVTTLSSCARRPPAPKPYLAFVANRASSTVAVVNLATFQMRTSIPVAPGPMQVVARPGARELLVLSRSGTVSVIAYPALRVTASIDIGSAAANLTITADGRIAAASDAREIGRASCR